MRAVIAVISDLATDMRVRKLALLMADEGLEVTLWGRASASRLPVNIPGVSSLLIRVPFRSGPLMYLFFNLSLFVRLLFAKFDICVACDLDTLLPCQFVSRLRRKKIIYDSHEYFTGQYGLDEKPFRQRLWKLAERMTVPKLKYMITVSDSIANLYRDEYGVTPVVVRNVAPSVTHLVPADRSLFGAGEDELLVIFQGSGINPGRGAEELVEAMALTSSVRLIISGSGDIMATLRLAAAGSRAADRIIFLPRMPWEEMMRYTIRCDAGLSLDTDGCINQRYSLPNKVFDYIAAGIACVVSPLPEVAALVREHECGVVLEKVTPEVIAECLEKLSADRRLLHSLKQKAGEARGLLNWETEKLKEQELIRTVINVKYNS